MNWDHLFNRIFSGFLAAILTIAFNFSTLEFFILWLLFTISYDLADIGLAREKEL